MTSVSSDFPLIQGVRVDWTNPSTIRLEEPHSSSSEFSIALGGSVRTILAVPLVGGNGGSFPFKTRWGAALPAATNIHTSEPLPKTISSLVRIASSPLIQWCFVQLQVSVLQPPA